MSGGGRLDPPRQVSAAVEAERSGIACSAVVVDLEQVDPEHLAELAYLLRERRQRQDHQRVARAAELLYDRPALGAYRPRREAS